MRHDDETTTSSPSLDYRGFFVALATARGAKEILVISFISSFGIGCVIGVVRCSLLFVVLPSQSDPLEEDMIPSTCMYISHLFVNERTNERMNE
jgi:hypothetical protein